MNLSLVDEDYKFVVSNNALLGLSFSFAHFLNQELKRDD